MHDRTGADVKSCHREIATGDALQRQDELRFLVAEIHEADVRAERFAEREAVQDANIVYQIHAIIAWGFWALFPFSRLVHAWSIPVSYLARSWIPFRSRDPRTARAVQRARAARASEAHGARRAP